MEGGAGRQLDPSPDQGMSSVNFVTILKCLGERTWHGRCKKERDFHALEKEVATHSGVLAWRIPGTGEPGGLPSVGSHRVGHHFIAT